ncbi:Putative Hydrophobin [Penicillium brasilianum]|uniref:Hydrophobin n=1 Tax=Penicillium brasilianum TaxID=104259 RepID=A0A0F7TDP0_PENBI|nr:Putative Hydrophobin [Penicillium brasilianum]
MHFLSLPLFLFATGAFALPSDAVARGHGQIRFPVPDSLTVKEAQAKCGDQAQLSCCNHATYAGDTTDVSSGILAGTLSHIAGTGSGADGLGLFDQCSQLDVQVPILLGAIGVQDLIKKHCQQNIACCQNSPSNAGDDLVGLGLPCVALGAVL